MIFILCIYICVCVLYYIDLYSPKVLDLGSRNRGFRGPNVEMTAVAARSNCCTLAKESNLLGTSLFIDAALVRPDGIQIHSAGCAGWQAAVR